MIALDDLRETHATLARLYMEDPALALANTVFWLCPAGITHDGRVMHYEDWDARDTSEYLTLHTMLLSRHQFPDIYLKAMDALHEGRTEKQIDQLLLDELNEMLVVPLDHLMDVGFGVPVYACGPKLGDEHWWSDHADFALILSVLGLHPRESTWDTQDRWGDIAQALVNSLSGSERAWRELFPAQSDRSCEFMAWTIAYLFGITSNTLCDWSMEDIYDAGFEPPQWTPDEISMANEINEDAMCVIELANLGAAYLVEHRNWLDALAENWKRINRSIRRGRKPTGRACRWPTTDESPAHLDAAAVD